MHTYMGIIWVSSPGKDFMIDVVHAAIERTSCRQSRLLPPVYTVRYHHDTVVLS